MNKILLILFILLASCNAKMTKNDFILPDEMNFDKFKIYLDEYAKNNPFPNIEN